MKNTSKLLAGGLTLLAGSAITLQAQKNSTPNVIYILADDLGYGDVGCYGQTLIKTPNIDKMAAEGMQFMQHYSACTVSAPARCGLMTGKHNGHTEIRGNGGGKNADGEKYDTSLPASEVTIAEIFKQKNYATACIGKWGLGSVGSQGHPNSQGFDYFYGYLNQTHAHSYYPSYLIENETKVPLTGKQYSHDLIEEKALGFIKANKDKPFFLYLAITLPHAEIQIPDEYRKGLEDQFKPETPHNGNYTPQDKPHATFAAMVHRTDMTVGRVEALLKELNIDKNTLVIFTSDNGPHKEGGADPKFFQSSGPFRGIKRDLYEGGIRIPMIARWPDKVLKGVKNTNPSAFWDVLPTICDLIKVKTPESTDGISFLPELLGKKQTRFHDFFYWEFHEQGGKQAVLRGDWKLIKLQALNPEKTYFELYNIKNDITESENLVTKYPDRLKELQEIMDKEHVENPKFKFLSKN